MNYMYTHSYSQNSTFFHLVYSPVYTSLAIIIILQFLEDKNHASYLQFVINFITLPNIVYLQS